VDEHGRSEFLKKSVEETERPTLPRHFAAVRSSFLSFAPRGSFSVFECLVASLLVIVAWDAVVLLGNSQNQFFIED